MKVYIAYCSKHRHIFDLLHDKGKYCITESVDYESTTIFPFFNNREKITKQYNLILERLSKEDCILVLVHDDVVITDKNWIKKLHTALEKYDVVGLAGVSEIKIQQPCLWHLMGPRVKLTGTVNHVNFADNSTFTTHFGPPGRALVLDGLFLAFNPKTVASKGIKFDETNPCVAHFYDIDFSLTCNKHGLKLGTVNIQATHSSPGLKSFTQEWQNGEQWFLDKVHSGGYSR